MQNLVSQAHPSLQLTDPVRLLAAQNVMLAMLGLKTPKQPVRGRGAPAGTGEGGSAAEMGKRHSTAGALMQGAPLPSARRTRSSIANSRTASAMSSSLDSSSKGPNLITPRSTQVSGKFDIGGGAKVKSNSLTTPLRPSPLPQLQMDMLSSAAPDSARPNPGYGTHAPRTPWVLQPGHSLTPLPPSSPSLLSPRPRAHHARPAHCNTQA